VLRRVLRQVLSCTMQASCSGIGAALIVRLTRTITATGKASALELLLQAREMMYHKTNINRIMAEYTGQKVEKART
jgi:ATP-dependent protease ClpP protease subunit